MTENEKLLMRALEVAQEALGNYAEPSSYHAIAFLTDPPSGWFADDFGAVDETDYGRPMPGLCARQTLEKIDDILGEGGSVG